MVSDAARQPAFTGPMHTITAHGGTIVDSTAAVVKNWQRIGAEIGVEPEVILATSHGRRSMDVLRIYEPKLANWDYVSATEARIPKEYGADAVEIPGARALLTQLEQQCVPWAIVTSGTRPLVTGWLDVMKLAYPRKLVVAEDVEIGKPDPSCYLLGKDRLALGQQNPSIIVFEDAPAGVRSGKAAGFTVVALSTTHATDQLQAAGADIIVQDMQSITLKHWNAERAEAQIEIQNPFRMD